MGFHDIVGTYVDPTAEKPSSLLGSSYIPRDENFSAVKYNLFLGAALGAFGRDVLPSLQTILGNTKPFKTFHQIHELYHGDLKLLTQSRSSNKAGSVNVRDETPISFPRPGVVGGKLSDLIMFVDLL